MPSIAALAFLQCVIYVTMGADPTFFYSPTVNGKGIAPNPSFVDTGPIIPDVVPELGASLFKVGVGTETKHPLPYVKSPFVAEHKQTSSSDRFQPSELSFSEWNSRVSKKEHQLRDFFADKYIGRVKACKKLRKKFQVQRQFDAKTLSSYMYKLILEAHTSVGSSDAEVSAQVERKAVAVNFGTFEKDYFLFASAQAVAKYLSFRDVLTTNNVASLSEQLFTIMEKSSNAVKKPTPEENYKAIITGYINFLKSLGLYTPDSTSMFSGLFANELYSLEKKSHHKRH